MLLRLPVCSRLHGITLPVVRQTGVKLAQLADLIDKLNLPEKFDLSKAILANGDISLPYCAEYLSKGVVAAGRSPWAMIRRAFRSRLFVTRKFFREFTEWRKHVAPAAGIQTATLGDMALDPSRMTNDKGLKLEYWKWEKAGKKYMSMLMQKGLNPSMLREPYIKGAPMVYAELYLPPDTHHADYMAPTEFTDFKVFIRYMRGCRRNPFEPVAYSSDLEEHMRNHIRHFEKTPKNRLDRSYPYTIERFSVKMRGPIYLVP